MRVVGNDCCWHIRHYFETTDKPMHYEHLGANYNTEYSQNDLLQNQQTSIEKDPGIVLTISRNQRAFFEFMVS